VKAPTKALADAALSTTGPQTTLGAGDGFNAGGHPTLNTKPFQTDGGEEGFGPLFTSNAPIKIKIEGQILPVNKQVLTPETVRQTAFALMSPEQREYFVREFELDFAISEPGLGASA